MARRRVEVISPAVRIHEAEHRQPPTFAEILQFMNGQEHNIGDKIFELTLLNTDVQDCLVGIIVTNQDKDIPPIRDKNTGEYSPVSIDPMTQGLAFANIFIYDTVRNVLIYEVNRNGCYLDQLISFVYRQWNLDEDNIRFNLNFEVLARLNEYERMLEMDYYKRIRVELYRPNELLNSFVEENDGLIGNLLRRNVQAGLEGNADSLIIEQVAMTRQLNPMGLSRTLVAGIVDAIRTRVAPNLYRTNVRTLQVDGYLTDVENPRKMRTIDLLADTFNEQFTIPDVQVHENVQQQERKRGIEGVYGRILPELQQITGR